MKLLILAFYLCVIVLVEDGSSLPQQPILGVYSPISINDDEVKQLVPLSLTNVPILINSVRNSDQISIDSAKYKVVAVKDYTLTLSACKQGSSNYEKNSPLYGNSCNTCEVTFLEQPWLNKTSVTGYSCVIRHLH